MNSDGELEQDKFACIHCGQVYHSHELRDTFCESCDNVLKVEQVFTMPTGLGIEGMRKFIKECAK